MSTVFYDWQPGVMIKKVLFKKNRTIKLLSLKILYGTLALIVMGIVYMVMESNIMGNGGTPLQKTALSDLRLPKAALVWSRNKVIMYSMLEPWNPTPVTNGESPRWSPDGSLVVFTKNTDVWIMKRDFSKQRMLFKDVVTAGGTGAFWTRDGKGLTAINLKNTRQVLYYELASGDLSVLHDEAPPHSAVIIFHKVRNFVPEIDIF